MNSVSSLLASSPGAWLRRQVEAHPFMALGLLAFAVRLATMPFVPAPGYMDACYHYGIASRLYHGHGFTETVVWCYMAQPAALEHPLDACWMSLQSVCMWGSFLVFGENLRAAQFPAALFSSALVALAGWVAWDLTRSRRYLWWTGWFAIFSGFWFPHWVGTDYYSLYGLVGAAALVLTYRAVRDDPRWFVPAGICGGLAYLARGHGQLFIVAMASCWLYAVWRRRLRPGRSGLWLATGLLAALLTMSPWLLLLHASRGAQDPGGFSKMVFQREFNELFAFHTERLDWSYYLNLTHPSPAWGLWPLAKSKLVALWTNLDLWARPSLFFMTPLFLLGLLARRDGEAASRFGSRVEFWPFWAYSVTLYLSISLVYTFLGTHGTTFHVVGALLPFVLTASLVGLDHALDWLGRRWRPEAREERRGVYVVFAFAIAVGLSVIWTVGTARLWRDYRGVHQAIAAVVAPQVPADVAVMILDPAAYHQVCGRPAVVIASEGPAASAAAARRYHAALLVLEARAVPPAFVNFYQTNGAGSADWVFAGQPLHGVKLFKPASN
jgi:4-amino-4-deoxy-L-arabinose transferase-like glycosyltransferase